MTSKKSLKELFYSKSEDDLDLEKAGLTDKLKAGLVAGAVLSPFSPVVNVNANKPPQIKTEQLKQVTQPIPKVKEKPVFSEAHLLSRAKEAGFEGKELAAFMAQAAHETLNFKKPREMVSKEKADLRYKGGIDYCGRGYLHHTHIYNYKTLGDWIGVDLVNNPHLLSEDPDTAANAAIAYWKNTVRSKVKDWDDVFHHSKLINRPSAKKPSQINGYEDRVNKYNQYLDKLNISTGQAVAEKSIQKHIDETLLKSLQEIKTQKIQNIVNEVLYKSLAEVIKKC